jgi:hypothetical protein
MTSILASARVGFAVVVGTILAAGLSEDAVAKVHMGRLHTRGLISESRAQVVSQQPARLGRMRYYGGPKSPMWREVR